MQKENPAIDLLCRKIEDSLKWGSGSDWIEQDFESLNDKIYEKTEVRLSVSTLKRIWGRVRYESSPSMVTLNTLAKFLDFDNWREFLQMNSGAVVIRKEKGFDQAFPEPVLPEQVKSPRPLPRILLTVIVILAMVLSSIGLASLLGNKNRDRGPVKDYPVKFESREISDGLPNSVVFDYDAAAYHSDR